MFAQTPPSRNFSYAVFSPNVAMSLAMFGADAAFATVLPKHAYAEAVMEIINIFLKPCKGSQI